MPENAPPFTDYLLPQEKVWAAYEVDLMSTAPGAGWRRTQIVIVNRGDALAQHRTDMGPRWLFAARPIQLPAFWEYTVQEVQDLMHRYRQRATTLENVGILGHTQKEFNQMYLESEDRKRRKNRGLMVSGSRGKK